MINNDYLAAVSARHEVDRLHREADRVRLLESYRTAHPELRLRVRLAGYLRGVADRLEPPEGPDVVRPITRTRRA